jgi:hypothetical protein
MGYKLDLTPFDVLDQIGTVPQPPVFNSANQATTLDQGIETPHHVTHTEPTATK